MIILIWQARHSTSRSSHAARRAWSAPYLKALTSARRSAGAEVPRCRHRRSATCVLASLSTALVLDCPRLPLMSFVNPMFQVRAGLFELSLCCEVAGVHELRVQLHQGSVPGEQGGGGGSGGERTDRLCGEGADDDGGVDVCGSPVSIVVTPAAPSPEHCTLTGDCLRLGTAIAGKRQDGPRISLMVLDGP